MAANYHTVAPKGSMTFKVYATTSGSNNYSLRSSTNISLGDAQSGAIGVNTPNFYARKRRGELLPFTTFDQYEYDSDTQFGVYDYQSDSYTATSGTRIRYENDPGIGVAPGFGYKYGSGSVVYDSVLQSLASSANGWDALTFVAEAHQLRSMVVGLVSKLSTLLRQRPPKFTVNQWLEYRYGWRVLYYDMLSIQEAYNSLKTKRRFSRYTSGTSFMTETVTFGGGNDGKMSSVVRRTAQSSFNIRARLVMKGEVNPIRINPLATSWELIRFSFVVDWFLSIGKAIDALSLVISGAHYVVGAGYKVSVENTNVVQSISLISGYHFNQQSDGYSRCWGECVSRSPASIPLRPLWNPRLTSGRLVDLIALILQRALR